MENNYKRDFPLLTAIEETGLPIAYLDNAATTQKPDSVIAAVSDYYRSFNANTHRGAYAISERATEKYEEVRRRTADFINAGSSREIVFTSGTTDAIHTVAETYGEEHIQSGDEILLSIAEHHSNLLPWQRLAKRKGAVLKYLYPDEGGKITAEEFRRRISGRTRLAAVTQVSNVLGAENPIKELVQIAHESGAVFLADTAQSVPHMKVDVRELDVDFLAFSGHKMLAPAGVGVLYGKSKLLEEMQPFRVGGGAVDYVGKYDVEYMEAPWRFEAGTQNAEAVIGLGEAMSYIERIGYEKIAAIEKELMSYILKGIGEIPGVEIYGGGIEADRGGILSFNVKDVHPHDTATILAAHGVAVRAGHHCAQPLMEFLGLSSTCRLSLYFYNTREDVERFLAALKTVRGVLGYGA